MLEKYNFLGGLRKYNVYAPLVLRVVLGLVFGMHGYAKLMNIAGTTGFFGNIGIPAAGFFAWFIALLEFVGGIFLILGFLVRYLTPLYVVEMLVVIFKVRWSQGLVGGYELELSLLTMALALAFLGAGKWSLDRKLCGEEA